MTNQAPPPRARNRAILLLIAAVFVAPIALAWLFATGVIDLGDRARTNHGHLVTPPVDLRSLPPPTGAASLLEMQPADWAVLYVTEGACDEQCGKHLQTLEVVRSLSGKEATRLSVFGLVAEPGPGATQEGPRVLVDQEFVAAIKTTLADRPPGPTLPLHAFVDWRGQLMMTFAADAPAADIKSDLVRLLRASAIK